MAKCRFCGTEFELLVKEGFGEDSYICVECMRLITSVVHDALPELLRLLCNNAEEPLKEILKPLK